MRILSVRFQNLNSLAGTWEIDFTHPAYVSDGIFAITGPTGSGKTTILDAICLGLYGRTPRLDKVTKSNNEIMSRQTGQCFAEVTFETQKGSYRYHWSQHRSRKKSSGELQPAKHEISDAKTCAVLESRITQVGEFIEKTTGMDFERFTRSMLLAQGGFASFLQADADKRSPILEQITGTGIYSLISMKVHERRREEQEKLELLKAELLGIQVLSDEEEAKLQEELKEKQSCETQLCGSVETLRKSAQWLEGIANLEKEISELDLQSQALKNTRLAFEPEAQKLERARKALILEGDYRSVKTLRIEQKTEIRAMEDAAATLPEKEQAQKNSLEIRTKAESGLEDARKKQSEIAEIIKRVREHDARLSERRKQLQEKEKALVAIKNQKAKDEADLENCRQELKKAELELAAVQEYLNTHSVDALLLTHYSIIKRELETLRELERRSLRASEVLNEAGKKKEDTRIAYQKVELEHEECRQKLEAGQIEQKKLSDELNAFLQGREIRQWHEERDSLKESERLLNQIVIISERMKKTNRELERLNFVIEILKASKGKISEDLKSAVAKKEDWEREIAGLETQVLLSARIRNMEEERKHLEKGKACPLCGATDHPYADGNIPDLSLAEESLKGSKLELKNASLIQSALEEKLVALTMEIQHREYVISQKKAMQDEDEKTFSDHLAKLNVDAEFPINTDILNAKQADVLSRLKEITGILTNAEELGKKEKAIRETLDALRARFDIAASAFRESGLKIETANFEYDRLIKERDVLATEMERERTVALQDVKPFGISQVLPETINVILEDLAIRHAAWQSRQNEKISGEKRVAELQAETNKVQAFLTGLEKDLTIRKEEYEALLQAITEQSDSRRALFGDKDPDMEEKRHITAVDQATLALEKGREEGEKIDREISILNEKIAMLKARTAKRAHELTEAEQNLNVRLIRAGFADESEFVSACLSEEERKELELREKTLIREEMELQTRIKDKSTLLAIEKDKNLTEQTFPALRETIAAGELDLKQLRLDIGGIGQRLSENNKQRERRRESIRMMEAHKKECTRWDTLHNLIGSADGKKFRNFAQGLTFEVMMAHANRQLRKMTDRYLLIRDTEQPLELNVIDNYQAGEIRSTKNLSGGESFIVSLALALGLSKMASRNVRVDSLFLDEGFGTLDDDALENALETLAGLHQDGKLIGIISHVPALKERIAAQITVTPETGGRSNLTGPGCRRI